jgi:hypothetical protein
MTVMFYLFDCEPYEQRMGFNDLVQYSASLSDLLLHNRGEIWAVYLNSGQPVKVAERRVFNDVEWWYHPDSRVIFDIINWVFYSVAA